MISDRQEAIDLCVDIQTRQQRLARLLRGTRIADFVRAQIDDTQAIESLLITDERVKRGALEGAV